MQKESNKGSWGRTLLYVFVGFGLSGLINFIVKIKTVAILVQFNPLGYVGLLLVLFAIVFFHYWIGWLAVKFYSILSRRLEARSKLKDLRRTDPFYSCTCGRKFKSKNALGGHLSHTERRRHRPA